MAKHNHAHVTTATGNGMAQEDAAFSRDAVGDKKRTDAPTASGTRVADLWVHESRSAIIGAYMPRTGIARMPHDLNGNAGQNIVRLH